LYKLLGTFVALNIIQLNECQWSFFLGVLMAGDMDELQD